MTGSPPSRVPADLTGVTVLVVDDELAVLDMLKAVLEAAGATVIASSSAYDAGVELATFRPDVVVTDLRMPGLDGYWVARRVRMLHPDVRVLAVTGFGNHLTRAEATEAGFADQMEKPLDFATFCTTVRRLARRPASDATDNQCPACRSPRTKAIRSWADGWAMRCQACHATFHLHA